MRATGGTIATASIFGTIAAIMTLVVGLASAFEAEKAAQISWSEWGGVFVSFATVFLGAICLHARSISAGMILMATSVGGAVVGAAFVAVFMALTFVGGAVASWAAEPLKPMQTAGAMSAETPLVGSIDVLQRKRSSSLTAAP